MPKSHLKKAKLTK